MKLLWSTESNITKDENGGDMPHLEITEVVLIHRNIIINDNYQRYQQWLSARFKSLVYICS